MNSEQRQHARRSVEIGVIVRKNGHSLPARLVDVSESGIGLVCKENPGESPTVQIPLAFMDDLTVTGAVKWISCIPGGEESYRIGIAADHFVRVQEGNPLQGFGRSRFVRKVLAAGGRRRQNGAALKTGEEQLRLALKEAGMDLWDYDPATRTAVLGAQLARMLGIEPDRMETSPQEILAGMHPADRQRIHEHLKELFGSGSDRFKDEFRVVFPDGEIRWLEATGRIFRDPSGRPIRMTGVNCDITERKKDEDSLRKNEWKFRSLFENLREAAAIYEPIFDEDGKAVDGIIRDANPRWVAGIGTASTREDVIGRRLSQIFGPDAVAPYGEQISELIGAGEPREFETFFAPLDRCYYMSVFPIGKNLVASASIDITEMKRSEEALRRARDELEIKVRERTAELNQRVDQLARLSSELTLAEERERRRLAERLHDHLQQLIVGAKINLETLSPSIEPDRQAVFEKVRSLLAESLQATRLLTAELSPPVLAAGNLSAALQWLAGWMRENHGLEVELQVEPDVVLKQRDLALLLFRSVRELLFNVVKHAGVKAARLELSRDQENRLHITVRDRGRGFEPEKLRKSATKTAGFGLLSVTERLGLMGGRLALESSPGQGAAFTLIVPLDKN